MPASKASLPKGDIKPQQISAAKIDKMGFKMDLSFIKTREELATYFLVLAPPPPFFCIRYAFGFKTKNQNHKQKSTLLGQLKPFT